MQQVTDHRTAPARRPTGSGVAFAGLFAVLMIVVVLIAMITFIHKVAGGGSSGRVSATLTVTLAPTPAGTDVTLRITSSGDKLPDRMDFGFVPVDDGIDDGGGNPFTGATLNYSQARDGQGRPVKISTPAVRIKDVTTDGHTASFTVRVAPVNGRAVVFPLPHSDDLRFRSVTVQGGSPSTSCLQSSGAENGRLHYHRCAISSSGAVDWGNNSAPDNLRLELNR
jgi:hypothetical protein